MYDLIAPEDDVSPEVVLLVLLVLLVLWLPLGDSESLDSMRSEISTMSAVGPAFEDQPAREETVLPVVCCLGSDSAFTVRPATAHPERWWVRFRGLEIRTA